MSWQKPGTGGRLGTLSLEQDPVRERDQVIIPQHPKPSFSLRPASEGGIGASCSFNRPKPLSQPRGQRRVGLRESFPTYGSLSLDDCDYDRRAQGWPRANA